VRATGDAIPTKKRQTESQLSIVQERKKIFKDLLRGGMETQTSSVEDKYFRVVSVCLGPTNVVCTDRKGL